MSAPESSSDKTRSAHGIRVDVVSKPQALSIALGHEFPALQRSLVVGRALCIRIRHRLSRLCRSVAAAGDFAPFCHRCIVPERAGGFHRQCSEAGRGRDGQSRCARATPTRSTPTGGTSRRRAAPRSAYSAWPGTRCILYSRDTIRLAEAPPGCTAFTARQAWTNKPDEPDRPNKSYAQMA